MRSCVKNKKGLNTIVCASSDDLVNSLTIVKISEENGEIDSLIDAASVRVRKRFGSSKIFLAT